MADELILHEDPRSGNCYKIKLTAAMLGIPLQTREYDIMAGETRTAEFTSTINAHGKIPVLQIGERFLPESNAACWYLAAGTSLVPDDRFTQSQMLRWMFFEQYSHEPNIATLRFWCRFVGANNLSEEQRGQMMAKRVAGQQALDTMEDHLTRHDWFAGEALSLADIALFAYTHVADEGGFSLDALPATKGWLDRVRAAPGFIAME